MIVGYSMTRLHARTRRHCTHTHTQTEAKADRRRGRGSESATKRQNGRDTERQGDAYNHPREAGPTHVFQACATMAAQAPQEARKYRPKDLPGSTLDSTIACACLRHQRKDRVRRRRRHPQSSPGGPKPRTSRSAGTHRHTWESVCSVCAVQRCSQRVRSALYFTRLPRVSYGGRKGTDFDAVSPHFRRATTPSPPRAPWLDPNTPENTPKHTQQQPCPDTKNGQGKSVPDETL